MRIIRTLDDACLPLGNTSMALGVFDGLHRGHQGVLGAALKDALEHGRVPGVMAFALSEPPPRYKKGAVQLVTPDTLRRRLEAMGMQFAFAPAFSEIRDFTPEEFVWHVLGEKLGARFVSCGYNFSFGKGGVAKAGDLHSLAAQKGIGCGIVPEIDLDGAPVSSSRIRKHIVAGEIPGANALLGSPFTIDFVVVYGNRIGRTLGFPTINQIFPPHFVVPRHGVYATQVRVDGRYYSGVTNVGVKPTIGHYKPLAETYIEGFSGNLYGHQVEVSFLEFIRPEQKFASLEELGANILRDAERARKIVSAYRSGQ